MVKYSDGKLGVNYSLEKGMHVIALKNLAANGRTPILQVPCSMIISAGKFFSGVTIF